MLSNCRHSVSQGRQALSDRNVIGLPIPNAGLLADVFSCAGLRFRVMRRRHSVGVGVEAHPRKWNAFVDPAHDNRQMDPALENRQMDPALENRQMDPVHEPKWTRRLKIAKWTRRMNFFEMDPAHEFFRNGPGA